MMSQASPLILVRNFPTTAYWASNAADCWTQTKPSLDLNLAHPKLLALIYI